MRPGFRSSGDVIIRGYALAADTLRTADNMFDPDSLPLTALAGLQLLNATSRLEVLYDRDIDKMPVPAGRDDCCGKNSVAVALKVTYSVVGQVGIRMLTMAKMAKIRCTDICRGDEGGGVPIKMSRKERCSRCDVVA